MAFKLSSEFVDTANGSGDAIRKKKETHRMAEENRAFAQFLMGTSIPGAHFVWAFSLMFLFSGRGYWQELIEPIIWAHNKLKVALATQPRALYKDVL
ncbi:hypothetical protein Golax_010493 [Gossypium laxum]|uniref:Small ribosomal subunit protein uS7 domain-containing protein n=1 Tax=Gossypium laxum TaxID=34288 RepID=A0A7J8ZHE4_9ROSI|nr:hypothetical protein [Gossypium laxum]